MPKSDWKKNTIPSIFGDYDLWPFTEVESVLDVACGLSLKSKYIPAKTRVGVDIFPEYFKHIESDVPYTLVELDIRDIHKVFKPKTFDIVIALDIVEHLEKDEALKLIKRCEDIAKYAVVIETPLGFIPQNIDITGYGGDTHQTHRSGWIEEEFNDMGYNTIIRDYLMNDTKRHTKKTVDPHIQLIDAIKFIHG